MANLYLVFDEQATNKTPHIVPKCYDAKQQETNSSSTVTLINYQSADGGIPVNFGLNILGWMVSETLVSVVEYLNLIFLPCFTFYQLYLDYSVCSPRMKTTTCNEIARSHFQFHQIAFDIDVFGEFSKLTVLYNSPLFSLVI